MADGRNGNPKREVTNNVALGIALGIIFFVTTDSAVVGVCVALCFCAAVESGRRRRRRREEQAGPSDKKSIK